jgi:hypothetical protein
MPENRAAFWSYAHRDDENDDGAVLRLSDLLRKQYELATGEPLEIFIDTMIEWGEEWKRRIDSELSETTFFIPVLTPAYFASPECRRELVTFASQAEALGVIELVCPILYSKVEDLSEDSADAAKALAAKSQYEDWTELRLEDPRSAVHRKAIDKVIHRLANVAATVAARQLEAEGSRDEESDAEGLGELLDSARGILSEWTEAAEDDGLIARQFQVVDEALAERLRKVQSGPASARYAILRKQVAEFRPLIDKHAGAVEAMQQKAVELRPIIDRVTRIMEAHPTDDNLTTDLLETLQRLREAHPKREGDLFEPIPTWARRHAHETRGLINLARVSESNKAKRDEAIRLIQEVTEDILRASRAHDASTVLSEPDDGAASSGGTPSADST